MERYLQVSGDTGAGETFSHLGLREDNITYKNLAQQNLGDNDYQTKPGLDMCDWPDTCDENDDQYLDMLLVESSSRCANRDSVSSAKNSGDLESGFHSQA